MNDRRSEWKNSYYICGAVDRTMCLVLVCLHYSPVKNRNCSRLMMWVLCTAVRGGGPKKRDEEHKTAARPPENCVPFWSDFALYSQGLATSQRAVS